MLGVFVIVNDIFKGLRIKNGYFSMLLEKKKLTICKDIIIKHYSMKKKNVLRLLKTLKIKYTY